MKTQTFPLSEPIELDGQDPITEVVLRSPKAREVRALAALERITDPVEQIDAMLTNIVALSDLTAEQAEELDAGDLMELSGKIADFFPAAAPPQNGAA